MTRVAHLALAAAVAVVVVDVDVVVGVDVGVAHAQQPDRFFSDKQAVVVENQKKEKARRKQVTQGSLTSTSFAYRETGSISRPLSGQTAGVENASRVTRLFTDMRAQLDARSLSGSPWNARADGRIRVTTNGEFQSGAYGGKEYEVRELYTRRVGGSTEWTAGRQFVLELAAVKVDGLRFDAKAGKWTYLGFAGAYPARGSRSVLSDYPASVDAMGNKGSRIIPVAGGLGAAYRFDKAYGAIGVVGILPRADEQLPGGPRQEQPRVFATSNGYWRSSSQLDLFHYLVVDAEGSAGRGVTNLTAGANWRPSNELRVSATATRVDTETLNVIAQTKLEDPDPNPNPLVQNNVEVSRISQESARLAVSAALAQQRFEVSVSGLYRRRPDITVTRQDDTTLTIPAAQAAEVTLQAVDRRSLRGHRISGSFTRVFGVGDANLYRTDANIVRLGASHDFKQGLGEYQLDLSYVQSADQSGGSMCDAATLMNPLACFGTSDVNTVSAGAMVFYRFQLDWFLIGGASVGSQGITITDPTAGKVSQPRILLTSAFLRAAYRF